MKHLFIVNPAAGKGISLKLIPEIKRIFADKGDDFYIEITERPGHASDIARRYSGKDNYRIYAVGGDGTLNEVLNGMAKTGSSIAVIPSGSGNDFIRSISYRLGGTNNSMDELVGLLKRTIEGVEEELDLAAVNGKYFINISSIGFDAEVVYNTNKFKKLPAVTGSFAYVLGVLYSLINNKSSYLQVDMDGNRICMKSLLIAVANGKYYGGGMMPAPSAVLNDGNLDICLIGSKSRFAIFTLFPKFIKGQHGVIKGISFHRAKKVEVSCDRELSINIDGEVEKVRRAVFEIIPKGIKIVIPAGINMESVT